MRMSCNKYVRLGGCVTPILFSISHFLLLLQKKTKNKKQTNNCIVLQYCAKVMQTKFHEFREYLTINSEISFGAIFDEISRVLLFEQQRYFAEIRLTAKVSSQKFSFHQPSSDLSFRNLSNQSCGRGRLHTLRRARTLVPKR